MSPRIGSAPSSNVEFGELEAERFDAPAPKKTAEPQSQASQVEPWIGQRPLTFKEPAFAEAMNNGQELAAQSAREAAERKTNIKALGVLQARIDELASSHPNGANLKGYEIGARLAKTVDGKDFLKAVGQLSPADVRASVAEQVKAAWPECSPKQTQELEQFFMSELAAMLRERLAPRLQETATQMLGDAAKSFAAKAANPTEVSALAAKLNAMAAPDADAEARASVRDLRAALGLDPDEAKVTPQELAKALQERGALMREESEAMARHGRPSLFRALADQDVGPALMKASGIRDGSLLAKEIDAVKEEGEGDKEAIQRAKWMSALAAAALTGGVGLGATVGLGVSAAMASPAVVQTWLEVDPAKAGESAGTMKAGAGEDAHRRAVIETVAAGAELVMMKGAGDLLHHAPLETDLAKGVAHLAAEFGVQRVTAHATDGLSGLFEAEGRASGEDALQRLAAEKP